MSTQNQLFDNLAQGQYLRQFQGANFPVNPATGQKRGGGSRLLQTIMNVLGADSLPSGVSNAINANNMGNIYEYNRQQEEMMRREQARVEQVRRNQFGAALGQAYPNQFNGSESYVKPEELSSLFPAYQNRDFNSGAQSLSEGGSFSDLGSANASLTADLFKDYAKRRGDAANYNVAQKEVPGLYGKVNNFINNNQPQATETPTALAPGNPYGINPNDPNIDPVYRTGISQTKPPSYAELMDMPTVPYQDVNQAYNNSGTLAESNRHNQATEYTDQYQADTQRKEYEATKANLGGYARYAPAGPAPNEAYYKNQYVQSGQLTPQEAFGGGSADPYKAASVKVGAIDAQMQAEGLIDSNGQPTFNGGFMGLGRDESKAQRFAQLNQAKQAVLQNVTGLGNRAVEGQKQTGRQAGADLQSKANAYLGKWK